MEQVFLGISMEDDGSGKKKDREVDVPSCGGGGAAAGDGGSLDLCFGFGYNTPSHHDVDEVISCHREKFSRTDAFPFRTSSMASPIFTAAASASTPLPPLHPSLACSLPFGSGAVTSMYGPNMFRAAERAAAAHQDAAARSLQMQLQASLAASPFKSASHFAAAASSSTAPPVSAAGTSCAAAPPGPATAALLPHHPLFTPAQWQELQRQALIYKHFVSSAPVPPDLIIDTRCIHPNAAAAPGGGFLNLRLSGGSADPEPGRCRRTDGKKWRCSRDAAPDQRYCERHLHRGRPRSRKPVERTRNKAAAAADGKDNNINNGDPAAASDLGGVTPTAFPGLPSKSSTALQIASPPPPTYCGPALPKPDLMKLPFLSMLPEKEEPRYLDWMMKGGGIPEISHHAASDNSTSTVDIACFRSTPVLPVLQGYPDFRQLNAGMSDLNAPSYYPLVNTEQPAPPRRFIDAWSAEGYTVGGAASSSSHDMPNNQFAGPASSEQLSPSSLTLSMSGGSGRGGDYAAENIQMGLSVNELSSNNKSQAMFGPFGGPLAEVLQSGSSVASPRTSGGGGGNDCCGLVGPPGTTSYTGLMNLMSRSCCSGSEGGVISPRGESPPRVLSSPTGVLQRGLVSLSDSSSNSSPRFETGCGGTRPEVAGLQWMNQNKKWW